MVNMSGHRVGMRRSIERAFEEGAARRDVSGSQDKDADEQTRNDAVTY